MLKFTCFMTGANAKILANCSPFSQKKYNTMAVAMCVPIVLWVTTGFILSNSILENPLYQSFLVAAFMGFLVFCTEKIIIAGSKSTGMGWIRFFLAVGMAFLGSIVLDEVIFKDDIETQLGAVKQQFVVDVSEKARIEHSKSQNLDALNNKIAEANSTALAAERSELAEADGAAGTGLRGVGAVAKLKGQAKERAMAERNQLENQRNQIMAEGDFAAAAAAKKAEATFSNKSLLIRIKALFQLVASNGWMLTIYIVLTVVCLLMELLVLVLKCTYDECHYEKVLAYHEKLGEQRLQILQKGQDVFSNHFSAGFNQSGENGLPSHRPKRFA